MRFSCESCKDQLQIADERVRGKRLIVRCRRCGSKIGLADPSLANSAPRLLERSPMPGPMRISLPGPAARPQTDDESTRAMDRDVLERALQASKADEAPQNGAPATQRLHFPGPAVPPEPIEWFAMIRGKQTGPLAPEELRARAHGGEIGPRTYLWREGMDAWQRAVDVPELSELLSLLPSAAARPPPPAPAAALGTSGPLPQQSHARPAAVATPQPAGAANEPIQPPPQKDLPPLVQRSAPMFESAAPLERGPFTVFLGLMALAAAAVALWIVLSPAKVEEPRTLPQAGAAAAPPPVAPPVAPPEAKPPDSQPPPPETPGPAAIGLTADQVHRKLDENKPALQGCVDEALRRDPQLKVGKIHVATTIAPSGAVTAAHIDQRSVDESSLGACLKGATRKILFPQFAGSAFEVDIPIVVTAESP